MRSTRLILLILLGAGGLSAQALPPALRPAWPEAVRPRVDPPARDLREACDNALPLPCGLQVLGSSGDSQEGNQWESYWVEGENAPEIRYELDQAGTYLSLDLHSDSPCDLDLFLLSACDPVTCLAMSSTAGSHERIRQPLAPGSYTVVVDGHGWNGEDFDFTLELSCVEPHSDEGPVDCQGTWESEPNEGWNADPPNSSYNLIDFDHTVCGSLWASGGLRDLDWYRVVHAGGGFYAYARTARNGCAIWLLDFAEGGTIHAVSDNYPIWTRLSLELEDLAAGVYHLVMLPESFEDLLEESEYSLLVSEEQQDDLAPPVAGAFDLAQNSPNPFNPTTTIRWSQAAPGLARLTVRNLLGQVQHRLELGPRSAGDHSLVLDCGAWPSGLYLYTLAAGSVEQTRKMLLLR